MPGLVAQETLTPDEVNAVTNKVFELFMAAAGHRVVPAALFHYTDSSGLKGIIETATLRATHIAYLNDASEYLHAVQLLLDEVRKERPGCPPIEAELLDEMEPLLATTRPDNVNAYFVSCFSEDPNSLNQWRAYGRGEGAFSIGFNGPQLRDVGSRVGGMLCPVIYDRATQITLVQQLLTWARAEYSARASLRMPIGRDRFRANWVQHLFKVASGVAPVMKYSAFAEEREWRLIKPMARLSEVEFLPKSRGLSPFISLRLGIPQTASKEQNLNHVNPLPDLLPITVIWTGPGQMKEVSTLAVRGLLEQRNYHGVKFEVSEIPYRVA